jgi:MFS transporter, DHA2 family, multidrug resistance protein
MSATPAALPASPAPPPQAPATSIPWLGLLAVLMGTFISTLNGRLSNFGLNDIRGAVHAGFDEGAWITTAQTMAQMLIAIAAVWLGAIYGPRRVLLWASISFALICLASGFASSLPMLLCLQFAGGVASGFFIPLTLGFILLNTPPKYWAFGIALYALNLELSLNISASLEGWYVEHLDWRWIFWQNVPLALIMTLCLRSGMKATPINPQRPPADWFGLIAGGSGLALIYAALDQGNRLDWLNSGLIWGLLLAGGLLFVSFVVHEARTPHPLINLKILTSYPLPFLLLLVAFLRLSILATAYLIPLYLGSVRGFRALEVGGTLWWIAAPQLILCPLAGLMLRRSDPRLVACIGLSFISLACLLVAWNITPLWGSEQFLPSQLLQAVGQSFALSGIVFFSVLHLRPQDALTFGAALQTARLMGGEIGTATVATLARVRGQVASNLIGQHVRIGDADTLARIRAYGTATTRVFDPSLAADRGATVLSSVVRSASTTQAVIDCFITIGTLAAIALLVLVLMRRAPEGPASAIPWIARRAREST